MNDRDNHGVREQNRTVVSKKGTRLGVQEVPQRSGSTADRGTHSHLVESVALEANPANTKGAVSRGGEEACLSTKRTEENGLLLLCLAGSSEGRVLVSCELRCMSGMADVACQGVASGGLSSGRGGATV